VKPSKAKLVSIDGVDAAAVVAAARRAIVGPGRGGISHWDASGIFQDLDVADAAAGAPSARTLLLLYAADLAFRLRWEIRPALAAGRTVVAAPYVATAVAFGRAAGVPAGWLANLFRFAPRASERRFVPAARGGAASDGFVEFASQRVGSVNGHSRRQLVNGVAAHLREAARRKRGAHLPTAADRARGRLPPAP
jgi:hypothetical protein